MKQGRGKPWEQQPGESGPAFEAFSIYRDLGAGRTVAAVTEKLQKSDSLLRRWKNKWSWRERVIAYDSAIAEEARRKIIKERKEMNIQHVKIAMQLQKKALEALNVLQAEEMTPKDIKEFIKMATDLERLSREREEQGLAEIAEAQNENIGGGLAHDVILAIQGRKEDVDD